MTSGEKVRTKSKEQRSGERFSPGVKVLGVMALAATGLAASVVMGYQGVQRGLERGELASTATEVTAGQSTLEDFDATFQETCRTAATISVDDAKRRRTYYALNMPVAWDEVSVDLKLEKNLCLKETKLEIDLDVATGHLSVNVPSKSDIVSRLTITPDSLMDHIDFSAGYAQYQNLVNTAKSTPIMQNLDIVKNHQAENDEYTAKARNEVVVVATEEASRNCNVATVELALPEIEQTIKDKYIPGRAVEALRHPSITPDDISVTVEGVPITEVTGIGEESNLTDSYNELMKFAQENKDFTISAGGMGDCKVSDTIQRALDKQSTGSQR